MSSSPPIINQQEDFDFCCETLDMCSMTLDNMKATLAKFKLYLRRLEQLTQRSSPASPEPTSSGSPQPVSTSTYRSASPGSPQPVPTSTYRSASPASPDLIRRYFGVALDTASRWDALSSTSSPPLVRAARAQLEQHIADGEGTWRFSPFSDSDMSLSNYSSISIATQIASPDLEDEATSDYVELLPLDLSGYRAPPIITLDNGNKMDVDDDDILILN